MRFRKDIQGLRALAFLLVFVFHLNSQWLPGGFVGVDIFFVISGFLMTSIILVQKENGSFNFYQFYLQRFKRIVPAQFVMLLFVAVFSLYSYLYTDIETLRKWFVSSALFFSNIVFAHSDNYFGAKSTQNPVLHTWSLSIEMQFYLFLPFLLMLVKNKYIKGIVTILIIILTGYSSYKIFTNGMQPIMYFSLLSRMPEFLVGVIFAIAFKNKSLSKNTSLLATITGLILIFLSAIIIDESSHFPGVVALIPCVGTVLILISSETNLTGLFSNKISVYVGELSYSLYLWHWPIMALLRYSNDQYLFTIQEMLGITLLTIVFAWLSYKYVESYFRNTDNKAFVKNFLPVSILLILLSVLFPKIAVFKKLPNEFVDPFYYGSKSNISIEKKPAFEKFGDVKKNDKILLIGDSNLGALKRFYDYIGKEEGFSFLAINTHTYPPVKGLKKEEVPYDLITPNQFNALEKATKVADFINEDVKKSDVIIITCARYDRIPSEKFAVIELAKSLKKEQKLVIIKSFPKVKNDINPIKINRGIVRNTSNHLCQYSYKLPKEIQNLDDTMDNVFVYDISRSNVFKNMPYYNDTIMYYDGGHLNYYGQMVLAKSLTKDFGHFIKSTVLKQKNVK
ncbi:acyltransferase family protein [Flavobacterium marginilacus]|uniref:acyltransferase family protein n=1 Tax=Flavobacterium marginilacus TaxID=3003256 RepID=UPI00248D7E87|nr:acyltransferase family protein [Flavobacterium marginilacus]